MSLIKEIAKKILPDNWLPYLSNLKAQRKVDFNVLEYLQSETLENLRNRVYLENSLLPKLGLNDELLHEFPEKLYPYCGKGLYFWQYPNQFSSYLVFLSQLNIKSYLEIGVRHGGTFLLTVEYLKRFNPLNYALGVDINYCKALDTYSKQDKNVHFQKSDSQKNGFAQFLKSQFKTFDLVLIDGNHDEIPCYKDFQAVKDISRVIVFHDIISDSCEGVRNTWNRLKIECAESYDFHEFINQYEEVKNRTGKKFLGLGVMVKKEA